MKKEKETFASLMQSFEMRYDLRVVFSDFLTLSLCALSQNPFTGNSYDEQLYLNTIENYKKDEAGHKFPLMLASLITEMEERMTSAEGNDVLGEFYEQHLYRKGASQFFTPWSLSMLTAAIMLQDSVEVEHNSERPLRILDPCCGSGRLLVAGSRQRGIRHIYYGIDIDEVCVKMSALNLFLNGVFKFEVMQADALNPGDFGVSYRSSFLPFGIRRITDKEKSPLWCLYNDSFIRFKTESASLNKEDIRYQETTFSMSQLKLFNE